jgi:hypothetical protein
MYMCIHSLDMECRFILGNVCVGLHSWVDRVRLLILSSGLMNTKSMDCVWLWQFLYFYGVYFV